MLTREEKEIRILQAIVKDLTSDDAPKGILNDFECSWNVLYNTVKSKGWDALEDIHIDLLYQWFDDQGFFY